MIALPNRARPFIWICAAALGSLMPVAAPARDVGVIVDGTALVFDQPPLERDGRVYVPLRGLFERLGASVVFSGGRIAITAGTRTIGLHIGESVATIDNEQQSLEAPPIVVGGRALVPLRFVAQALGASVAFDSASHTVTVIGAKPATPGNTASTATTETSAPAPTSSSSAQTIPTAHPVAGPIATDALVDVRLLRLEPAPQVARRGRRPEVSATFAETIDPATIAVTLDGRDETADTVSSPRSFVTDPSVDLESGTHTVVVTGRTPDKERFEASWTFTTVAGPSANYVSGLEPVTGTQLDSANFDVSGLTRARSRVRIVATTSGTSPSFSDTSDGSQTIDVVATAKGYFEVPLVLVDHGAGLIDVRVTSTAPDGSIAVRTLRLRL